MTAWSLPIRQAFKIERKPVIDFTTFTSVRDLLTGPAGILLAMAVVSALFYWRTRSMHVLWSRLWTLFISRRRNADSPVERFHEEQMEMLKFRFYTKIPVRTPRHVTAVIEWMRRHDQDAAAIVACGSYFDVAIPGLSRAAMRVKSRWASLPRAVTLLFLAATSICLVGMAQERALLRFDATGNWFSLDAAKARPIGNSAGFLLGRCGSPPAVLARESGFTPQEVNILCETARSEDVGQFVRRSVEEQRFAFAVLAVFLAMITMFFGSAANEVDAMLRLRKVLSERADSEAAPVS